MATPEKPDSPDQTPLILDIDGSLLRTDLLLETFWAAMGKNFFATLWVVITSLRDPAVLKRRLLLVGAPDIELLPVQISTLEFARHEMHTGRRVILTSGADQEQVEAVARRLDFPGPHFGSNGRVNLTGTAKASFLMQKFGKDGFDYVGNSTTDLKVWQESRRIIAVAPEPRLASKITALGKPVQTLGRSWRIACIIKEMRPYQWIKNILLFFPLLAAHSTSIESYLSVLIAFFAFCMGTSAVYIVNDLLDLDVDRQHPEKRHRPIASGDLPIGVAMTASVGLGTLSLVTGWLASWEVTAFLALYFVVSLSYSLKLKSLKWLDLFVLASLYTLRVLTGAAATDTALSGWLTGFVFAVFFTLAIVKRLTGLARASNNGRLRGRGYVHGDTGLLAITAYSGVAVTVALLIGYSFTPAAETLYTRPMALHLVAIPVALWMVRMIRLSMLGKEDYDPVSFVEHDRLGLAIIAAGLALVAFAY